MHKNKKYCVWTDETLSGETARESGLIYGVYNNHTNRKCSEKEQGGIITSYDEASKKAAELNN